jgi:hypothetical protein
MGLQILMQHWFGCSYPSDTNVSSTERSNTVFFFSLTHYALWSVPIQNMGTVKLRDIWYDSSDGESAGLKVAIYTGSTNTGNNIDIHPCLEWDSNPRFQSFSENFAIIQFLMRKSATVSIYLCYDSLNLIYKAHSLQ